MLLNAVVGLALFACSVSAQTNATYIDPSSVTPGLKASWCNGQENVCTTLCLKQVNANTCDPTSLTYSCLCASNNSSPDLAAYKNSMPSFICQQSYGYCISNNANNQEGEDNCTTTIQSQCATLDIAKFVPPTSTSSSASAPAATGSATSSGSATAATSTPSATKSSAAVAAVAIGQDFGASIIVAGLVALFGFMV